MCLICAVCQLVRLGSRQRRPDKRARLPCASGRLQDGCRALVPKSSSFGGCLLRELLLPVGGSFAAAGSSVGAVLLRPAPPGETEEQAELSARGRLLQLLEQSPPRAAWRCHCSQVHTGTCAPAWALRAGGTGHCHSAAGSSAALPAYEAPDAAGTKDSGGTCACSSSKIPSEEARKAKTVSTPADLPPSRQPPVPQAKQALSWDGAQGTSAASAACPCQVISCSWQRGVFRVPGCLLALHQYPSFPRTRLAPVALSHGGRARW